MPLIHVNSDCDLSFNFLGRIPPSRITDLRVVTHFDGPRPDLITLTWTAPGDNLNEGTVGKNILNSTQ